MFELFLTIIVFIIVFFIGNYWLSLISTIILLILVLPGLYAMFRGAPFIPSSDKKLSKLMELGQFKDSDVVYDLGCGDGKVIRAISAKGVKKAVGLELSIPVYFLAHVKKYFSKSCEELRFKNFWKENLSEADVLICFLLQESMNEFKEKIWPKLKKGVRVTSNEFPMEDLDADKEDGRVYLYIKK